MQSLIITAQSAWSTLLICDRQARKDVNKVIVFGQQVYEFFSSAQAIATYRTIWGFIQLACMATIWLGTVTAEKIDGYVQSCLKDEAIAPSEPTEDKVTAERPIVVTLPACGIVEDSIILPSEIKPAVESSQQLKRKARRTRKAA